MRSIILAAALVLAGCEVQPLAPPVDPAATTPASGPGSTTQDARIVGVWSFAWPPESGQPDGEQARISLVNGTYRLVWLDTNQEAQVDWDPLARRWMFQFGGKAGFKVDVHFNVSNLSDAQLDGGFGRKTAVGSMSGLLVAHRVVSAAG